MNGTRKNVRTKECKKMFASLPLRMQKLAEQAFDRFCDDSDHPSLRRHQLEDTDKGQHRAGSYSISVTKRYRALYYEDGNTNVWYWIGSHAEYGTFTGGK